MTSLENDEYLLFLLVQGVKEGLFVTDKRVQVNDRLLVIVDVLVSNISMYSLSETVDYN